MLNTFVLKKYSRSDTIRSFGAQKPLYQADLQMNDWNINMMHNNMMHKCYDHSVAMEHIV